MLPFLVNFVQSIPYGILILDKNKSSVIFKNTYFEKRIPLTERDFKELISSRPGELNLNGKFYKLHYVEDKDYLGIFFEDITPLKTYQRAKKEFVANVSHELKTPISAVRSIAETLYMEEENEFKRTFLERILKRAEEMEALVEDLLILAALESKEGKVLWERVKLKPIVDEIYQTFSEAVKEKELSVENLIPENFTCLCDSHKIYILLKNLIENAIKYNKRGGKVWVKAWNEKGNLILEVGDTGIGIPKKYQPLVFERFYRVDKSRSKKIRGTGLGLSIVKHITLLHGGKVDLESAEGKGSIFRIKIPQKEEL